MDKKGKNKIPIASSSPSLEQHHASAPRSVGPFPPKAPPAQLRAREELWQEPGPYRHGQTWDANCQLRSNQIQFAAAPGGGCALKDGWYAANEASSQAPPCPTWVRGPSSDYGNPSGGYHCTTSPGQSSTAHSCQQGSSQAQRQVSMTGALQNNSTLLPGAAPNPMQAKPKPPGVPTSMVAAAYPPPMPSSSESMPAKASSPLKQSSPSIGNNRSYENEFVAAVQLQLKDQVETLLFVRCDNKGEGLFPFATNLMIEALGNDNVLLEDGANYPAIDRAMQTLGDSWWAHAKLATADEGIFRGMKAVGIGSNKKTQERAVKLALALMASVNEAPLHDPTRGELGSLQQKARQAFSEPWDPSLSPLKPPPKREPAANSCSNIGGGGSWQTQGYMGHGVHPSWAVSPLAELEELPPEPPSPPPRRGPPPGSPYAFREDDLNLFIEPSHPPTSSRATPVASSRVAPVTLVCRPQGPPGPPPPTRISMDKVPPPPPLQPTDSFGETPVAV